MLFEALNFVKVVARQAEPSKILALDSNIMLPPGQAGHEQSRSASGYRNS
jgi:hypothetical protein